MEKDFLKGWICTDPDNHQYCIKHSDNEYTYRQMVSYIGCYIDAEALTEVTWNKDDFWNEERINYNTLSERDINNAIDYNGYADLDEVKQIYGDAWKQIVIESYFEEIYN